MKLHANAALGLKARISFNISPRIGCVIARAQVGSDACVRDLLRELFAGELTGADILDEIGQVSRSPIALHVR